MCGESNARRMREIVSCVCFSSFCIYADVSTVIECEWDYVPILVPHFNNFHVVWGERIFGSAIGNADWCQIIGDEWKLGSFLKYFLQLWRNVFFMCIKMMYLVRHWRRIDGVVDCSESELNFVRFLLCLHESIIQLFALVDSHSTGDVHCLTFQPIWIGLCTVLNFSLHFFFLSLLWKTFF